MTALAGTPVLVRLAARRDRILMPVWLYLLTAVVASTAFSLKKAYPTAADRAALAAGVGTTPRSRRSTGPPTPPRSAA
jgi:ABC-2 type transport system permease protein